MVVYALKTDAKLQKISEIATNFFALVLLKCGFERNFFWQFSKIAHFNGISEFRKLAFLFNSERNPKKTNATPHFEGLARRSQPLGQRKERKFILFS